MSSSSKAVPRDVGSGSPLLAPVCTKVENEMMTVENIYVIALVGFPIGSKK